jgi:TatD DNase family protein
MTRLPPIDMHAHIEPRISAGDLADLGCLVFSATRSTHEAEQALRRVDDWAVWGVGCHPGLAGVHKTFDLMRFTQLVQKTAYVSEIGLDGKSRVPIHAQQRTLDAILSVLQATPRIASVHSFMATQEVIDALNSRPARGVVLHWWLGDSDQTIKALDLGCYFSVNASSVRRKDLLDLIPMTRIFPETDHPFGDRYSPRPRRPGSIMHVEAVLATHYRVSTDRVRRLMWSNLSELVDHVGCGDLLPRRVRGLLATLPTNPWA